MLIYILSLIRLARYNLEHRERGNHEKEFSLIRNVAHNLWVLCVSDDSNTNDGNLDSIPHNKRALNGALSYDGRSITFKIQINQNGLGSRTSAWRN